METKSDYLETDKKYIKGLMSLVPTEDSREALLGEKRTNEVKDLDEKTAEAMKRLADFADESLTNYDLNLYAHLAAKTGNPDLFELVEVRDCYQNNDPILQGSFDKAFSPLKIKFYRNASVVLRDKALKEGKRKYTGEAGSDLTRSMEFYNSYEFGRKRQSYYEREDREDYKLIKQKLDTWRFFEEISKAFKDEIKKHRRGINTSSSKGPLTKSELFFSQEVIDSAREAKELVLEMAIGKGPHVDGVDKKWLNVYFWLKPDEKKFPQVYREVDKVLQYAAGKHEADLEKVKILFAMKQGARDLI